jgi:hypothetical protein
MANAVWFKVYFLIIKYFRKKQVSDPYLFFIFVKWKKKNFALINTYGLYGSLKQEARLAMPATGAK